MGQPNKKIQRKRSQYRFLLKKKPIHFQAAPIKCKLNIFVDETNEYQFPEIVSFMERMSTPIPDNLKLVVEVNNFMKAPTKL